MRIEQGTSCQLFTFNEYELQQHEAEIRKPLEEEIIELKESIKEIGNMNKCRSVVQNMSNLNHLFTKNDLWDADKDCEHNIINASGGGIKCTKCRGWFCY